jgi:hypothetical protein
MSERGDSCFPSMALLTDETGLALRTVKEHIALAASDGWIGKRERRMANGQGWRRNEYFARIPPDVEAAFHEEQRGASGAPPLDGAPPAPRQGGAAGAQRGAPDNTNMVRQAHLSTSSSSSITPRGAGGSRRPSRTAMPDGFNVSDRVKAWARKKGFEPYLEVHLEHFLGHCKANSALYVDWDEALMNCIRADWGGVRRQAQMLVRAAGGPAAMTPTKQETCAYCQDPWTSKPNGIPACDAHMTDALDQKSRVAVPA